MSSICYKHLNILQVKYKTKIFLKILFSWTYAFLISVLFYQHLLLKTFRNKMYFYLKL